MVQGSSSKGGLHPTRGRDGRVGGRERSVPWGLAYVHRARPRPARSILTTQPRAVAPPAAWVEAPPAARGHLFAPTLSVTPPTPLQSHTRCWAGAGTLLTAKLSRFACSAQITTPPRRRFRRQRQTFLLSTHARCTSSTAALVEEARRRPCRLFPRVAPSTPPPPPPQSPSAAPPGGSGRSS